MRVTGIIAEYNPFHNGHKYHLEEARRITDADYVIAVISGNFVQRGAPAVADKYIRAEACLNHGADLVLELPLFYSVGSAEYFAAGAVSLLDKLGAVTSLCFGSECNDISRLSSIASLLLREPEEYRVRLLKALKAGHSFPKARSLTLESYFAAADYPPALFSSPNNILGIEYIKSLLRRGSSIIPYTVKRKGSGYHDHMLSAGHSLGSASAIRNCLMSSGRLSDIRPYVPASSYSLLKNAYRRSFPICSDDFSSLLHYKLLSEAPEGFRQYFDVSRDLSDKICRNVFRFSGYEQFCSLLKSRNLTYAGVSRSLLHILLNMTREQMEEYVGNDYVCYARILGFRKKAAPLLKKLKAHGDIPMISKLAAARRTLSPTGLAMLGQDVQAAHIYQSVISSKFHTPFVNEYVRQLLVLD